MQVTLTWQTIITAAAVLSALIAIVAYFAKIVRWFDKQKKQDDTLVEIKDKHSADIAAIQKEQQVVVYGLLACLKGLQEQGCNGPVTDAINKLEKHLNKAAHEE